MSAQSGKPTKPGVLEVTGKGPVMLRVTPLDATSANLEIGIDYSRAEDPGLRYDADYCDVLASRTGLTLVFGRLKPSIRELRSKIEIAFSEEFFMRQVWFASRAVHTTARSCTMGNALEPLSDLPDPDKVQCFRANTVFMALLVGESVIDFYYISPGDIHLARDHRRSEIPLEPVVRVVLSTPLLVEFLDKCQPFADRLRPRFSEE
jgi:hypothetical protein